VPGPKSLPPGPAADASCKWEKKVTAIWQVLALVSVRGSIHHIVLPGLRRDEVPRTNKPDRRTTARAEEKDNE
jgi:hypothetical protein